MLSEPSDLGLRRKAQAVILATGSEVQLALKAQELLARQKIAVRVVSMPSTTAFDRQDAAWKRRVLPAGIPRIAVDGSEQFLTTSAAVRSSETPFPADMPDSSYDGLEPQDIDGDGLIGAMRVKDPAGPWKISERDDRIMRPRGPGEYGGEYYFVLPEGLIRNWDGGKIALAPPRSALDFNRNFPADWKPHWDQTGSGPFPLSEPETRAVADFLRAHPNIHGAQLHHTAAGMILRASARYADEQIPPLDRRAYDAIGAIGTASTGFRCYSPFHANPYQPGKPSYGVESDWLTS